MVLWAYKMSHESVKCRINLVLEFKKVKCRIYIILAKPSSILNLEISTMSSVGNKFWN